MKSKKLSMVINLGDQIIKMVYEDFDDEIDLDEITKIRYDNLYGEAVTIPALLNKIGMIKAKAEEILAFKKLQFETYEAQTRKSFRREAAKNSGKVNIEGEEIKLTEKALDEIILLDEGWQVKKKNQISAQTDLAMVDSIFWAIKAKDGKLSNLLKGITPDELANELIEGKINGILLKKRPSLSALSNK